MGVWHLAIVAGALMEIPKKYKPKEIEDRWKARWAESKIYAWDPSRGREETFVVDTPPPTVSGSLHVGHLFSYAHADFIVRYQRMLGKNIFYPIGWDDNGLPTERRVQNLLNVRCEPHVPYDPNFEPNRDFKKKDPPTSISRKNFVELCDEVVIEDEKVFKALWTRLGMSYDWGEEYATINEHCRRIAQYSFLKLLEDDEVYQSRQPVLWDVDFQTAVSQAELTDKEIGGAYHHLTFRVEDSDDKLVVATTRPELLPACVAVVVHPDDERYTRYVGRNAVTPMFSVPVPIIEDDKADPEKGTGVVMVCTFGDQTDVEWWSEYDLPMRWLVDRTGCLKFLRFYTDLEDGRVECGYTSQDCKVGRLEHGKLLTHFIPDDGSVTFTGRIIRSLDARLAWELMKKINGKYVKQARRILMEEAESMDGVIAAPKKDIMHSVKFYEKGDRPLEFSIELQWYTKIMDKKEALIEQGRKIAWHPDYMRKRYEHWVEGLNQDWCLSRQRFFGVPFPVWYKIDEKGEVLYDERLVPAKDDLPVDPLADSPPGYTEDQRNQPDGFSGEEDVFDTWATSSLSPQIGTGWYLNPEKHEKLFPMDMRPQAHDIIRTWAFYTIVKAYLHEREVPWKNIVLSGWILDPDRKKMSKSQGNVVTPEPLVDEFGADSVRYWAGRARLGVDTAHDEQSFKVGKRLCMKVFNASKFVIDRFGGIDVSELGPDKITAEIDRAAIAELRPLIERATKAFDDFDYAQALTLTEEFFWGTFCDNYIEIAKPRTYDEALTEGRLSAASALRIMHRALLRMLAPFIPYITEEVWHWAYSGDPDMHESIHRSPWPTLEEFDKVPAPASDRIWFLTIFVAGTIRREKAKKDLSIKAPLPSVEIKFSPSDRAAIKHAVIDLERMLSIQKFEFDLSCPAGKDPEVAFSIQSGGPTPIT